ncbi:MAG: hypothetical protein FWE84_04025, partial [Firmicutes bacterium]|nr:hypothetical protein [Bacillota bacterium]
FFKGWMRPDKLPQTKKFSIKTASQDIDWWDYFGKLSTSYQFGNIPIRGGLYYSLDFFESYQKESINVLKRAGELS